MPTTDEMTRDERRKYLKRMKTRYVVADRAERSRLLTEMEQVTDLQRKSLIRLLNAVSARHARNAADLAHAAMGWKWSMWCSKSGKVWTLCVQSD